MIDIDILDTDGEVRVINALVVCGIARLCDSFDDALTCVCLSGYTTCHRCNENKRIHAQHRAGGREQAEAYIFTNFKRRLADDCNKLLPEYTANLAQSYIPPAERPVNYWDMFVKELKNTDREGFP
jgi:hypothetical protein